MESAFDELCYMAVRANFLTLQIPLEWSISAMMGENYWFRVQQISINVDCVERNETHSIITYFENSLQ